ncbi:dienelactone hydrolase family protein [Rummeliibacillus pycnus]|uniref:dienelactone hydrolase family protein n=1 Tax=Rummeliibacillus pycnus TaxID=101070 RepID=UPI003D265891
MNIFEIKHNRKNVIVLLHEIYGINDHIKYYANLFCELGCYDVVCPDLLKKDGPFTYDSEQLAYQFFTEKIGFEEAATETKKLIEELSSEYEKVHIVGFSIGATVAWLCSEMKEVDRIVCVYGSRIRIYLEMSPACPVLCMYGETEKSFDVSLLVNQLEKKDVETQLLTGTHGFANPYSKEFNRESYIKANEIIKNFLLK